MSMYITFTWQRPAISSRADGCVKEGPVRVRRRPGLGNWGRLRQAAARLREPILSWAGKGRPRLGASAGLTRRPHARAPLALLRSAPLAGSRRTSAKARTAGGGGPAPFPPAFSGTGSLPPASAGAGGSALLPMPRADVGPRSSRGRIREGQPSRSAVARAPPHGCPAMACCRHPAGAGRQRAQGRRQPSGWRVDGIVVTCSDPAQRCRAAPAAALGEPVFAEW